MVSFEAILIFYAITSISCSNQVAEITYTLGTCQNRLVNRKVETKDKIAPYIVCTFVVLLAHFRVRANVIDLRVGEHNFGEGSHRLNIRFCT